MKNKEKGNFSEKLKAFLHDPIDKCFKIQTHEIRAKKYAEKFDITGLEETKGADMIASAMERSLLPKEKIFQNFNIIKHPLSEQKISTSKEKFDEKEIFNLIEKAFEKIKNSLSSLKDDKVKFFFLWRNLQEELYKHLKNQPCAKYLSILPADTRIPDHSIWEHLKIASALNALWNKTYESIIQNNSFFLFTIGPVQSFISQARKTQDFYMGSFILSFLTFKAMEEIIDQYGPTNIIYPDLYKQPLMDCWLNKNLYIVPKDFDKIHLQIPTIPNRFVAIIPETNFEEIKKLTDKMETKIKSILDLENPNSAISVILKELKIEEKITDELKNKIKSQLSEFPEIYWVAIPWKTENRDVSLEDLKVFFENGVIERYKKLWKFAEEKSEHTPNIGILYELLYSTLEKSMGARKNVRTFKQSEVEERGRKCSVCGERDVVFFRAKENRKFTKFLEKNRFLDLTEKVTDKYLADGEGLCAICFIKRTFDLYLKKYVSEVFEKLSFPSIAEIASADWKEKVIEKAKSELVNYTKQLEKNLKDSSKIYITEPLPKLKNKFKDIRNKDIRNFDGQFFYEENITANYFKRIINNVDEAEITKLRRLLKDIYKKVNKPNSYYAVVYFDGDNMGRWLSGELLPSIENGYNPEVWEQMPEDFKKELKSILPRKPLTPAIHASISTALRNYALEFVRQIVEEEHLGKLIYAGGDDVLAFVNLKDLFDVINKLRWAFSGHIKFKDDKKIEVNVNSEDSSGFVLKEGKYLLTMGANATASAGIVIAHYKTPLQIVIKKVFDMEKEAKKNGKNGFAICLLKRSGEERVFQAKWLYDSEKVTTVELIKKLIKVFDENNAKGFIAKSFIQKLEKDFIRSKDENGYFVGTSEVFNKELKRLIERSYNFPKKKITKEERKVFIQETYKLMQKLFWNTGGNINNFLNLCRIATFILNISS